MISDHFVKIENSTLSPIEIDTILKKERNATGGISPLFVYEILKKTNHYANLKFILKEIDKVPDEEKFLYKSFVLGAIEQRAHVKSVYEGLRKLAVDGGYLDEFTHADHWRKVYFPKSCKVFYPSYVSGKILTASDKNYDTIFIAPNEDDIIDYNNPLSNNHLKFRKLMLSKDEVLPQYVSIEGFHEICFAGCDLSKVEDISLSGHVELHFENLELDDTFLKLVRKNNFFYIYACDFDKIKNQRLEFKEGAEVELFCSKNLPEVMDFSKCNIFRGDTTSYEGVKEVIFGKETGMDLDRATCMPEVVRLHDCNGVGFHECDFKNVKKFDICNVRHLGLRKIENLDSCEIDFSQCQEVELFKCIYNRGGVSFAENSNVTLDNVYLPKGTDLSKCKNLAVTGGLSILNDAELKYKNSLFLSDCSLGVSEWNLSEVSHFEARACYFTGVKEIKFKQEGHARFVCCYEMPQILDVSMLNNVELIDCSFNKTEKIIFKNAKQLRNCIKNGFNYKDVKDKVELVEKGFLFGKGTLFGM